MNRPIKINSLRGILKDIEFLYDLSKHVLTTREEDLKIREIKEKYGLKYHE